MHAAGPGMALTYQEMGGAPLPDGTMAQVKDIAQRARFGEAIALRLFEQEGELLSRVLSPAVNLLNPCRIVLGGGVALAFDLFGDALGRSVAAMTYRRANPHLEICPTPLGYEAGLYSGAAIAIARRENHPIYG